MKKNKTKLLLGIIFSALAITSCIKNEVPDNKLITEVLPKLTDYKMYEGTLSDLKPANGYVLYEESSALFTDSCEKQRLIMIPTGTKMTANSSGLPVFPEGTVVAKTFYYINDKQNTASKKQIIETRVLIYTKSKWIGGTYEWNTAQTEATLLINGDSIPVNWKDENGKSHSIEFKIAKESDCFTCHKSNGQIAPIGPQIKFWNRDVNRDNKTINQLTYFQNIGILNTIDAKLQASFVKVPDYSNPTNTIADRARSYLDANCAYCHSDLGFASTYSVLRLNYELELDKTNIKAKKTDILRRMDKGTMPMIPNAIIDKEAIAIIAKYFATIPN